ncbi:MAG: hypothetical protein KAI26_05955 [Nanoarchaeota archaeon]|nr:hypothetical protein [Nanoarchaeota archaeon]
MKKSLIILFAVILLLLPVITLASEDKIFSGWVYPGETLTANDVVFSYVWREDVSELRLIYLGYYKTVELGECEILKAVNDTIKLCYDKNEYDLNKREFRAYLYFYSLYPDIELTRKFEKTELIVGESVRVQVQISNTGGTSAYNLLYEDTLEDFELEKCENCDIKGNTISWQKSHLDVDSSEEFAYYIKPEGSLDRTLAAVLKYDTLRTSEEMTTGTVKLTAEHMIGIKTKFVDEHYYANNMDDLIETGKNYGKRTKYGVKEIKGKELEEIRVGENLKFIIELTNNKYEEDDDTPIKINNLEIKIPQNFDEISESWVRAAYNSTKDRNVGSIGLEKVTENIYMWSGYINDYRKYFVLSMKAKFSGHPSIYVSSEFEMDKEKHNIEDIKSTMEVINVTPRLYISFEQRDSVTRDYIRTDYLDTDYTSEANKLERMKIRIDNPSPEINLKSISIVLDSEIFPDQLTFFVREIPPLGSKLVDVREFRMPHVSKDKTYPFRINLSWKTEFNEALDETTKKNIRVESLKDIGISHKFSTNSPESGEAFFVTVSLENKRPGSLKDISISDDIKGVALKSGVHALMTDIKAKTKIEAYKYELIAPEVSEKTKMCINTTAKYILDGSEQIIAKEGCFTVKPKKIDLRIDPVIPDNEIYVGEIFDIDYTITNRDKRSAFDILFEFPLSKDFDLVSEYLPVKSSRLDQDEVWKIENWQKVRAKKDGKLKYPAITLSYNDYAGNEFISSGKSHTIKIESQKINTPMLVISKEISAPSLLVNETLNVTLTIQNLGMGFASNITVWDDETAWELPDIGAKSIKIINYNKSFNYPVQYDPGKARLHYSDGIWDYVTASEHPEEITVIEEVEPEEEEEITIVEEPVKAEPEEKKPLVDRIIDFVLKILFWQKDGTPQTE